jgi:hypothetical protein
LAKERAVAESRRGDARHTVMEEVKAPVDPDAALEKFWRGVAQKLPLLQ